MCVESTTSKEVSRLWLSLNRSKAVAIEISTRQKLISFAVFSVCVERRFFFLLSVYYCPASPVYMCSTYTCRHIYIYTHWKRFSWLSWKRIEIEHRSDSMRFCVVVMTSTECGCLVSVWFHNAISLHTHDFKCVDVWFTYLISNIHEHNNHNTHKYIEGRKSESWCLFLALKRNFSKWKV